jgi:hypothetical protein
MKKLHVAILALSVATLGIPVLAHGDPGQGAQDEAFVADEGGKSWDVINPEILRNDVDRHVQLSVHAYPDKGQIHVVTVTII